MTDPNQPVDWMQMLDDIRQQVLDWLQEQANGRSAQMSPYEEEATLGPWARIWTSLLEHALRGPYRHMTSAQLSTEYNEHSTIFELTLGKPQTGLEQREQTIRNSLLSWIDMLGSKTDDRARAYLTNGAWVSLLVEARTLAAADNMARRADSRIEDAVRRTSEARSTLDGALQQLREAVSSAQEAATRAENAEIEARKAAGEKGLDEFGEKFGVYAKEQTRTAATYRGWTIVVLVVALLVATGFVIESLVRTGGGAAAPDDWHSVVYRLAIIAGLTGLSAYLGRQSTQHRRLGDWAHALEVQSRSFGAFAEPIADLAVKNSVYSAMSARLLAPPPDKQPGEAAVPSTAIDRIVDAIIRRGV